MSKKKNQPKEVKQPSPIPEDLAAKLENVIFEADRVKGQVLVLHETGEIATENNILNTLPIDATDDPVEKHRLYYKLIERELLNRLPKGKANARARELIREEKCTFLTRGKRIDENGLRHADSRQTYLDDAKELYLVIYDWANRGANMIDLYNTLVELNIKKGYGKRVVF
jgi:hypothetical protein